MINEEFRYMVAIECMTFQQSKYIKDALDGFCMQKTSFPFIAIVIDDASPDGEQDVINNYLAENFDEKEKNLAWIKDTEEGVYFFARHKVNKNCFILSLNLKKNLYKTGKKMPLVKKWFEQAKYTALCEGDDYWTDPYKLQKQVDYMEGHEDCVMCVNRTSWLLNNGNLRNDMSCCYENDRDLSTDEIIRYGGLYVNTVSTIYRKSCINKDDFPWWKIADVGDYPLHIAASLCGKVRYFADDMSVYRYQCEGSWTSKTNNNYTHIKNEVTWMEVLDKETNEKYTSAINYHLWRFYSTLYKKGYVRLRLYWKSLCKSDEIKTVMLKRMFKDILIRMFK